MGWYNLGLANIELTKRNIGDKNELINSGIIQLNQAELLKPNLGAYDLARAYAVKGESENTIKWLSKWKSYPDYVLETISNEADFDSLKDEPILKN